MSIRNLTGYTHEVENPLFTTSFLNRNWSIRFTYIRHLRESN